MVGSNETNSAALAELASQEAQRRLTFMLGENIFAVGIERIKDIVDYRAMTTVPGMPPFVRGVVELRGTAIPVVDFGVRIGVKPSRATAETRVVIIEVEGSDKLHQMGIVVDAVVRTPDRAQAAEDMTGGSPSDIAVRTSRWETVANNLSVREQPDVKSALHGVNSCRRALAGLAATVGNDTRPEALERAIAMAAAAGVVGTVSSLVFARAAMLLVNGSADALIAATCAGSATHEFQRRLADIVSDEIGLAVPWFGMCVVRFHVASESVIDSVTSLLLAMENISRTLTEAKRRMAAAERPLPADALSFVRDVRAHGLALARHVDEAIELLVRVDDDVRAMQTAIAAAKSGIVPDRVTPSTDAEPLASSLLLLAKISRVGRGVERNLGELWSEVARLSSCLSDFSAHLAARQE